MKINIKAYSTTGALLNSIVFLVLGAFLITNSDSVITWLSYIGGGFLSLIGLIKLITYYRIKKKTEIISNGDLIFGILFIGFGIICFCLAHIFEVLIRFMVGSWILFSGVQRLIEALRVDFKTKNIRTMVLFIVAILLIILGLYIILYSNLIFKWIGILMVIYSILEIIGYIFFSQPNKEKTAEPKPKKIIIEHQDKK